MSAGALPIRHAYWCPARDNEPPKPKRVVKGVVVEWEHPPDPRFDCLCRAGQLQLTDPRPEILEEAVARALFRADHGPLTEPADPEVMEVYRARARVRIAQARAGVFERVAETEAEETPIPREAPEPEPRPWWTRLFERREVADG